MAEAKLLLSHLDGVHVWNWLRFGDIGYSGLLRRRTGNERCNEYENQRKNQQRKQIRFAKFVGMYEDASEIIQILKDAGKTHSPYSPFQFGSE